MKIIFSHYAFQKLEKLDKNLQTRITQKLRFYSTQKDSLKLAKRLKDRKLGQFSFRVGDYRVIFDLNPNTIFVVDVGRRDEVYE